MPIGGLCAITEMNVLFLNGQIRAIHSGFTDQTRDMVNPVAVMRWDILTVLC